MNARGHGVENFLDCPLATSKSGVQNISLLGLTLRGDTTEEPAPSLSQDKGLEVELYVGEFQNDFDAGALGTP